MDDEKIGKLVLDSAFKVRTALGPGLLESAYETCMDYELRQCGLKVLRQHILPVEYEGIKIDAGYRIDLLVNHSVMVELKTVDSLKDVHFAQLLSYLKLGCFRLGYLINFNVKSLRQGIKRIIN